MAQQRPASISPAILASAEDLPLADKSVDAAMGVLTIHHWQDPERGIREMQRVARDTIALITFEPEVSDRVWMFSQYVHQIIEPRAQEIPSVKQLTGWLGNSALVSTITIPHDCTDGLLLSYWRRPEALLDSEVRAATSLFAALEDATEVAIVARLAADLESGHWDQQHGHLRKLEDYDAGLRLIVASV